jgi:hypothetical protein
MCLKKVVWIKAVLTEALRALNSLRCNHCGRTLIDGLAPDNVKNSAKLILIKGRQHSNDIKDKV